ncbi:MAG: zinc-ribbon domain-containing protein [Solirubrobacterales bacterium]
MRASAKLGDLPPETRFSLAALIASPAFPDLDVYKLPDDGTIELTVRSAGDPGPQADQATEAAEPDPEIAGVALERGAEMPPEPVAQMSPGMDAPEMPPEPVTQPAVDSAGAIPEEIRAVRETPPEAEGPQRSAATCSNCQEELVPGARFCTECGTAAV